LLIKFTGKFVNPSHEGVSTKVIVADFNLTPASEGTKITQAIISEFALQPSGGRWLSKMGFFDVSPIFLPLFILEIDVRERPHLP
jgi:hypothetical protein